MSQEESYAKKVRKQLLSIFSNEVETLVSDILNEINSCVEIKNENINIIRFRKSINDLINNVYSRVMTRFLIQEFQVFKNAHSEDISDFIKYMATRDKWKTILEKNFPSLLETLNNQTRQASKNILQTLADISINSKSIVVKLPKLDPLIIEGFEITGDRHNDGKSTYKLIVSEGSFFYKQRTSTNDDFFKSVLRAIGESSVNYYPVTLDFKRFSIHESKDNSPDQLYSLAQARKFYCKIGSLLACCDTLNISDIHYENIIVVNKTPVIIDFESMLLPKYENESEYNVLSSFILPRFSLGSNLKLTEKSGLSKRANNVFIQQPKFWASQNDFGVEYIDKSITMTSVLPILENGIETVPRDFYKEIITGYRASAKAIQDNHLKITELFNRFKRNLSTRSVLRNTNVYAKILSFSYHPDFHFSKDTREKLFYRMKKIDSFGEDLNREEVRQLINGDIPFFLSRINSYNFVNLNDKNYFKRTGEKMFFDKLHKYKFKDYVDFQVHLIILSLSQGKSIMNPLPHTFIKLSDVKNHLRQVVSTDTGNGLYQLVQNNDYVLMDNGSFSLYDGYIGVAFSMLIYDLYDDSSYFETQIECLNMKIIEFLSDKQNQSPEYYEKVPQGLTGIGGVIWYLDKLCALSNNETFFELKDRYIAKFLEKLNKPTPEDVDYISGNSGTITAILNCTSSLDSRIINWIEDLCNLVSESKDYSFAHGAGSVVNLAIILKKKFNYVISNYNDLLSNALNWSLDHINNKMKYSWCKGSLSILSILIKDNVFKSKVLSKVNFNEFGCKEISLRDHSLCHGQTGYHEICLRINKFCSEDVFSVDLNYAKDINFKSGLPNHEYNIGIFNGLSGILYHTYLHKVVESNSSALFLE